MTERSEQVTIALTIALTIVVTYYGAALLWQYHRAVAYDRELDRRMAELQHEYDNS